MRKKVQECYNNQTSITIGKSKYLTTFDDLKLITNIILPKLKQKEPINLFCSFSYFTSNYTGIFLMNELSQLMKQGCNAHIIMWDLNCESHPHFQEVIKQRGLTPAQLIDEKMQEIRDIFKSLETPLSKLKIYRASDTLNRFIHKKNPHLFLEFYKTMEKINLNYLMHKHKASHLIQMPFDMFFANFLHELYPEDVKGRMNVVLCYGYQESIFRPVLNAMTGHELTGHIKLPFLVLPSHPYLIFNGALPNWTMNRDAIVHHILSINPAEQEINQCYDVILKKLLDSFIVMDNNKQVKEMPYETFINHYSKMSLEDKQVSLAYNFHKYLMSIKEKITPAASSKVVHLKDKKDTVRIAKILSRKRLVDVLNHIDGNKNATQIAKELRIARSNMSVYLNELKKHELISVDDDGRVQRKITAITANFELGMR